MASPTFVAISAATVSATGVGTVTKPASVQEGDLILLLVQGKNGAVTVTPPAGFTLIQAYDSNDTFNAEYRAYWKLATASEPSSYTLNYSPTSNSGVAFVAIYRGVDQTAPINVSAIVTGASTASIPCPSVTTTVADTMLVCFYGDRATQANGTFTPPTGMTNRGAFRVANGYLMALDDVPVAAIGATGTKTATASPNVAYAAMSIAIAPGSTGGGANITLTGSSCSQSNSSDTGVVTVTPPAAGTVNLVGSSCSQANSSGTGVVGITSVATATVTSSVYRGKDGLPKAGITVENVVLMRLDRTVALSLANQVTNGAGRLVITSSSLTAGTNYMMPTWNADGSMSGNKKVTAV